MAFGLFRRKRKKNSAPQYYEWVVKDIIHNTANTISVVFDTNNNESISYRSGQFVTLIVVVNGTEVRRSYSLYSSPFVDKDLAITIKRVDDGILSNYLSDTLKKGETLKVMKPMGQFGLDYNKHNKRHLVMFAGGVGITPLFSILKSIIHQEPDSTVSLLYCNRDVENIVFNSDLDALQAAHVAQLRIAYALDDAPAKWQGYSGLLDQTMFSKFMEHIPDWGADNTLYFMCGPEGMMSTIEGLLEGRSVPKEKIVKESFTQGVKEKKALAKPVSPEGLKKRSVTILHTGSEYKLNVNPNQTILEAALEEGIDMPFSCQSGMCTACRGKALSGKVKMDEEGGLSQEECEEGYVLTCVGHPLTDDVVIEIG